MIDSLGKTTVHTCQSCELGRFKLSSSGAYNKETWTVSMRFIWHQTKPPERVDAWGFVPPGDFATCRTSADVRPDESYRARHPKQCNSGINLDGDRPG